MDDEAHVGAIDAHPEGDRRHDDVRLFLEEGVLVSAPLLVWKTRVIWQRAHTVTLEPRRERVHFAARRAVDDARLAAMARQDVEQLLLQIGARQHAVEQVRTIEGADELE